MVETMLERMAQTLREIAQSSDAAASDADPLAAARTVLAVMREPTENMAIAGGEAVPGDETAIHSEVAKDVWRAMIEDARASDDG